MREGFLVLQADTGEAAIALVNTTTIDLALVDLVLADIDGIHLLGLLRSLPGGTTLSILALVGELAGEQQDTLLQADFTDYILTPVDPERLVRTLTIYLPLVTNRKPGVEDRKTEHPRSSDRD
jgi:DNA-binding response OmpR family regulator